ncbi:MAG: UDP-glucose 4-epimerase GalE [Prochlorococcus marinus XMU1422]|nr:UDP-glucose 4-epimerase GalE [Prochlorococcus marinus XMU1421]MBO7013241.1 UDP-glucose 4-epimerase GalE [Prochlorococcus marinus XMU1422]MCR8542304.1 UDP-glucose 4-epimerase GalE [Prochlorococcus marinus XMU1423]
MKTILITGGAGFLGSHTCVSLLESKYKLIVIDSNINSNSSSLEKVISIGKLQDLNFEDNLSFFKGDIRDQSLLEKLFSDSINNAIPIDGVIHFAGLKSVEDSVNNPYYYWDNNVGGTLNLLKSMIKFNCRTIVFSSSATIYGKNSHGLINEASELNPVNPYGRTKFTIEKILTDLFNSDPNKWRIANLRYFNPIGAHSSGLIGEEPVNLPNNLFPYICKVAERSLPKLNIFGNNWPTKDGTCIRDFIHVMDLADAHKLSLNYLFNNQPQIQNFNIGTGQGTSVLELILAFQKFNNIKIPYVFSKRRNGDVAEVVADNEKALRLLRWKPLRNLEDMCKDGWNWKKINPNGYE